MALAKGRVACRAARRHRIDPDEYRGRSPRRPQHCPASVMRKYSTCILARPA